MSSFDAYMCSFWFVLFVLGLFCSCFGFVACFRMPHFFWAFLVYMSSLGCLGFFGFFRRCLLV